MPASVAGRSVCKVLGNQDETAGVLQEMQMTYIAPINLNFPFSGGPMSVVPTLDAVGILWVVDARNDAWFASFERGNISGGGPIHPPFVDGIYTAHVEVYAGSVTIIMPEPTPWAGMLWFCAVFLLRRMNRA